MEQDLEIRESVAADRAAIQALYPRSFPDEDLLPLVTDLLRDPGATVSLVAAKAERVVGNVMFTRCTVKGHPSSAALLAPLAVAPDYQRQGIGAELVREGLRRLEKDGVEAVYVLGDPAYYGRLGFSREQSAVRAAGRMGRCVAVAAPRGWSRTHQRDAGPPGVLARPCLVVRVTISVTGARRLSGAELTRESDSRPRFSLPRPDTPRVPGTR